jgi:SAM-dependent methyltransferase
VDAGLKNKSAEEIFDYYRVQAPGDETYVGYSEWTLKRAVVEAAHKLGGDRIVDLGCGPNPVTLFEIHKRSPHMAFTGVELSTQFGASAAHNATRHGVPFEIVTASAHATGLPADAFDGAILAETLEHVPDEYERPVLEEVHRVLRPGGWLIVSVPNARSLFDRYMTWRRGAAVDHPQHLREYTPERLRKLLLDTGFQPGRALRIPPPPEGGRVARLCAFVPASLSLKAAFIARAG